jgi:hypothetical protein
MICRGGGKKKKGKETEYWNAQLEYTFEGEDFDVTTCASPVP